LTISTTANSVVAQGNGATTSFSFGFPVPSASYLQVFYADTTGAINLLPSTSYSVTGIGSAIGGAVTYPLAGSPIPQGSSLLIQRVVPYVQLTDLINQAGFYPNVVENALDFLTMEVQQIAQQTALSLQVPYASVPTNLVFPNVAGRANKLAGFDSSGNVTTYPITASVGAGNMTSEGPFIAGTNFTPGTTTTLTLSQAYGSAANIQVHFDGVYQGTDQYSLSGTQLTFASPIPGGTSRVYVVGGTTLSNNVPAQGSVGDSQIAWGSILSRVVSSVATLRTMSKNTYTRVFLSGYYAPGDGGGGHYWYDPTDTTSTDNGGTIIVATDGGRWKLQLTNWVSCKQFGAKGDGATDDTAALQAWLNIGGNLWAPAGNYKITSSLTWAVSNTWIQGAGRASTIFNFSSAGTSGMLSGTQGASQLLYCRACDIQFLDNGGLGQILDMKDMMFSALERCFTFGKGGGGSIGVKMWSTNTTLQCTYNTIRDHYNGNTQYGIYMTDGANANLIEGGRFQSPVASAIGILLAPTAFNNVNGNTILGVGVEQPGNTMTGIQLNGNTKGTSIIQPRLEQLLIGIVVSSTDQVVGLFNPYYDSCTTKRADPANVCVGIEEGKVLGTAPPVSFNFNGPGNTTSAAVGCSIVKAAVGQYVVTISPPFPNAAFKVALSSSQPMCVTNIISASQVNVLTYNSSAVAADAVISGEMWS